MTTTSLVMVPGMDGTGALFGPLRDALPGREVLVASYASESDEATTLDRATRQLSRYVIVAESFGGPIAIRHAARRPEGLRGLVLVATFARSPVPRAARGVAAFAPTIAFAAAPPDAAIRLAMTGTDAPETLVGAVRGAIASVAPGVMANRVRRIASLDVLDEVPGIDVPVLQLVATNDRLVRPATSNELTRGLEARSAPTEVRRIEGPHLLLQSRPRASAVAIETWLGRVVV